MKELTTTDQTNPIVLFAYETLDAIVQQFYAEVEVEITNANEQYRAALGAIIQQVIDVRGKEEALQWAMWRFNKSERTIYRYLQIAEGHDPYPQLRQDNDERRRTDEVLSSDDKSSTVESDNDIAQRLTLTESNTPPQSDSTEIDVAAMVAENNKLKQEKAELASQLQQSLQQNTTTSTPIRHHGGNGTHKGPPTSEKDGVKRVMRDYTNWQTEAITVPTGFFCNELKSGVLESLEDSNKLIAYMQNDTYHRVLRVEGLKNDRDLIAQEFENLAKKIRAYKV
jgi:hypothetical protein